MSMTNSIQLFKNVKSKKPLGEGTIDDMFRPVVDSEILDRAEQMVKFAHLGDKENYQKLKVNQLCFMPSCKVTVRGEPPVEQLEWMVFDFDHVKQPPRAVRFLKAFPWLYGAQVSASGQGVYAVAKTDPTIFEDQGIQVDRLADMTRLRIYSDGYYWINRECETFRMKSELDIIADEAFGGHYHHGEYMSFLARARSKGYTDEQLVSWTETNIALFSESSVADEYMKCINYVVKTVEKPPPIRVELPQKEFHEDLFQEVPDFPLDVFPDHVREYILEKAEQRCLDESFVAMSCICAVSAMAGKFKSTWGQFTSNAVIWGVLCGPSGSNKTTAMTTPLGVLYEIDQAYYDTYKAEYNEWKFMSPKERKDDKVDKPQMKHCIITDATPEAIIVHHQNSPNGFLWMADELIYLLNGINKYNSTGGGDYSFLLDLYNGKMIKSVRAGEGITRRISNPRVPILGGIQTRKLKDAFVTDGSGFIDRFLFAVSNKNDYRVSTKHFNDVLDKSWKGLVKRVFNSPGYDMRFDDVKYISKMTDEWEILISNDLEREAVRKAHVYTGRLAVILQLMYDSELTTKTIPEEIAAKAYRLMDYFLQARGVVDYHIQVAQNQDPTSVNMEGLKIEIHGKTKEEKKEWACRKVYTGYAKTLVAKTVGVSRPTLDKWLSDVKF
jgi:hypothetical protein